MKYTVERVAACDLQVGDVVLRGGLAPKSDRFTEMTVSDIREVPESQQDGMGKDGVAVVFDDNPKRVAYYPARKELLRVIAGKLRTEKWFRR